MRSYTGIGLAILAMGCGCNAPHGRTETTLPSRQAVKSSSTRQAAAPPAAEAGSPVLPAGVLARTRGVQGVISVEERRGLRVLAINGVVQGAVRQGVRRAAEADPMVELVTSLTLPIKRALVIGLGTGQTATQLVARLVDVEVAELEPRVIAYARSYFGYKGHAAPGDGLKYLQETKKKYDLILMDAFSGRDPVPHLVSAAAIQLMKTRLTPAGIIAMRLYAAPGSAVVKSLRQRLIHAHVYGDGVGQERQNLYLLSSKYLGAKNILARHRQAVRPVWLPDIQDRDYKLAASVARRPGAETATVTLIGYLIIEQASGALAVDLPHFEMGAVRYLLKGDRAAALARHLPAKMAFPTLGAIPTDGEMSKTLKPLLGGGGSMRSDMRYSPVAVAIKGEARLLSVIHPDAPCADLFGYRCRRVEPRLPWGGVMYELEVAEVMGVLSMKRWERLRGRVLRPAIRRAARALARGRLKRGAAALRRALKQMEGDLEDFGPLVRRLNGHKEIVRVAVKLEECCHGQGDAARTFGAAITCDDLGQQSGWTNPDYKPLSVALRGCAERLYAKTAGDPGAPHAGPAAARLSYLWERRAEASSRKLAAMLRARIKKLKKRFVGKLTPLDSAPALPGTGK